ncbi:MAG: hypothetical protein BroJett015_01660 [Chloroflexota bacterium]|nr:hypothetical protein [Ardenticatenaceae bacterium]GIK54503.1 MAG: hypothetical protein BroJett015_01660 [Chloroflexota bacterium]
MVFIIACLAVLLPVLLGGFLAWVIAGMDTRVNTTKVELEEKDKGYNPALTFGHKIKVQADPEAQLVEARRLAAKQAAAMPRGANMQIGRLGEENLVTAGRADALQRDPVTAVRIAAHHGWDGARTGAVAVAAAPAAAAPVAKAASAPAVAIPGKDFPVITITDSMSPEEIRKARIANAKAKSAAAKAAKAAGTPAAALSAEPGAPQPVAAAAPAATAVAIEPPQLIEITDGMSPDDVRKARIANSKATSAFNKALKAAGIDPKDVEIVDGQVVIPGGAPVMAVPAAAAVEEAEVVAAPVTAPAAVASAVPEPNYIEITDDMSPDEVRKARIQNSKLKSEYNKALKAAGIDPKTA